jgi:small subunit ribosomal protein S28e
MAESSVNEQPNAKEQTAKVQAPVSKPQGGSPEEGRKFEGYLAEVVEVNPNRTGIYGEIKQAMCRVLEGRDTGRVIRRNVSGRIKVGDKIRLPDTTREDKPIRAR